MTLCSCDDDVDDDHNGDVAGHTPSRAAMSPPLCSSTAGLKQKRQGETLEAACKPDVTATVSTTDYDDHIQHNSNNNRTTKS